MRLEKEIIQDNFRGERYKAVLNIICTASWVNVLNTRRFKVFGISPEQYNVLRILRGQPPRPATAFQRVFHDRQRASRLVLPVLQ